MAATLPRVRRNSLPLRLELTTGSAPALVFRPNGKDTVTVPPVKVVLTAVPAKWQRIGNQIDAAAILTRTNLLEALRAGHRDIHITLSLRCGEQKRQNADCRSMVIPIPLTFRWKISTPCYAIGEHAIIRKAAENTFSSLGWRAKWKEQHCLEYVRWGVLAKLHSKISTVGVVPTDRVAIWVYETNNPSVSLVKTSFYTKIKFFNKDKQQKRIADFCRTVECEFRKFKIILIEHNRWAEAVSRYPQLRCSPVWGRGRYGLNEPVA